MTSFRTVLTLSWMLFMMTRQTTADWDERDCVKDRTCCISDGNIYTPINDCTGFTQEDIKSQPGRIESHECGPTTRFDTEFCTCNHEDSFTCKPVPTSCQDLADAGTNTNGYYTVDLGGLAGRSLVLIECQFDPVTVSIIHHDSEAKTEVKGCETEQCYTREVQYQASMEQMVNLIAASSRCYQEIRYDCYNSLIHFEGKLFGAWFGRDGTPYSYWTGSNPEVETCACGLTGTCGGPVGCACDMNDNVWRFDEGLLERKESLPVTKLGFGDVGSGSEVGYHTLGPLMCEHMNK